MDRSRGRDPAFLTLVGIPFTFSIANGLAFGIAAHALIKMVKRQDHAKDWLLLVLAGLFIARFVWLSGAA
jgi:AGZA family xanthine/uracil permease-like MFS transporter